MTGIVERVAAVLRTYAVVGGGNYERGHIEWFVVKTASIDFDMPVTVMPGTGTVDHDIAMHACAMANARAAIAAMRKPTDEMIKAGALRWHEGDPQTPRVLYLGDAGALVWERAIDAALDEPTGTPAPVPSPGSPAPADRSQ